MIKKKIMDVLISIFSNNYTYAAILSIAAFIAAYNAEKSSKDAKNLMNKTVDIDGKTNTSLERIEIVSKNLIQTLKDVKQANLSLELNKKSLEETYSKIIEAQNATIQSKDEILGITTGGNSYPYFVLQNDGFLLCIHGKYSIPELKISINLIQDCLNIPKDVTHNFLTGKNPDKFYKIVHPKFEALSKFLSSSLPLPLKLTDMNLGKLFFQKEKTMHGFDIVFESKYKTWIQRIRIISHNNNWEVTEILEEQPNIQKTNVYSSNTIFKHVSPNFPNLLGYKLNKKKAVIFYSTTPFGDLASPFNIIELNRQNEISNYPIDYFTRTN